jgi:hypothetical protein
MMGSLGSWNDSIDHLDREAIQQLIQIMERSTIQGTDEGYKGKGNGYKKEVLGRLDR